MMFKHLLGKYSLIGTIEDMAWLNTFLVESNDGLYMKILHRKI